MPMFSEHFICAGDRFCDYDTPVPAPLFRKSFVLNEMPQKATLTICGLGFYELFVNGKRITRGALTPYISNPDDILYYDCYDLREDLQLGENVLGIVLGNGFMNPFGGAVWDFDKVAWRGAPRVAFALELKSGDALQIIEADETVKTADSPIWLDDLRIGAFYDANLEIADWNCPGFDDSGWRSAQPASRPRGEARLCEAEPVVVYAEKQPISIRHYDDFCFCCETNQAYQHPIEKTRVKDTYLYDFGENNSGVCRLKIQGRPGQKVTLRFAEMLVDGYFTVGSTIFIRENTQFYLEYPQMDVYVCKGDGVEEYIPPFTYHGFQYVLVEGITPEQATEDLLTYLVMSSDLKERGDFTCSDETLNRLFDMTKRSDRSNFICFPTDCPHREKNGWTADAALSAEHMLLHMSAASSFKEWMRGIAKAQRADGMLPGIIPTGGWGFEWGNGPAWDCVCVYLPYYCYQYDGDIAIIQENRTLIRRYLQYIDGRLDENGLLAIGLGDWCQPTCEEETILSPLLFTDSVMVWDIARKAAFLFEVIGDAEAAAYAHDLAFRMRKNIRTHLIDLNTMTAVGNCQTSQALIVDMDLLDEDEKPRAVERLVQYIHQRDDHLLCGVIGGRHIFHVLAAYGHVDLALKMITRTDFPSYGMWVAEGATTLAEEFTKPGDRVSSRNHHFWGDIAAFFMKELAGLRPNPYLRDLREYTIEPVFAQSLAHASASFVSPWGKISVSWERQGEDIRLTVEAPTQIYGSIRIPAPYMTENGVREWPLKAGTYRLIRG